MLQVRVLIPFIALAPAIALADDTDQLDRYLQRLGLTDLRLVHQEKQLAAARDDAAKTAQARDLSDLYAQRLLEAADEPERFGELVSRVKKLVSDHPAVDSPQLQVMLLQAEYQLAEARSLQWIDEPGDVAARREAKEILARIGPQLEQRRQELTKSLDELQKEADAIEEPTAQPTRRKAGETTAATLEQEMVRLQAVLARSLFFEGWANFFHGLLEESDDSASTRFTAAEQVFSRLMEIGTDVSRLELEPESLGLESVWRSRALMGLGATLSALGKEELSRECFAALAHPSTAPAVRESALYWHLLALVGTRRYAEAQELASAELRNLSVGTVGRTPACVLLVRTGWATPNAPEDAVKLARLGLEGLARLKQFDVLGALLARYRPEPKPSDGFYALWGKGNRVFAEAEKSKAAADYQRAAQWFKDALDLPEAKDDPAAAAQCRYSLAWCHYRSEEYDAAIRLFEQAASQLKALGDDAAVQSAWMAFTCHQQLHAKTKDSRHQKAAVEALTDLRRDFPQSDQAQRAELLLARLNAAGNAPQASVKTLAAVPPDSPNYVSARYELCVARHQLWTKSRGDTKGAEVLAKEVLKDVDIYLAAAPQSEGVRRVRAALLAVDVLLAGSMPEWDEASTYLARIRTTADMLPDDDPVAPEYHYRRLQLAQHTGDESQINEQAAWLAKNASGSPYELPALVIVARRADELLASAVDEEKEKRRQDAIAAYDRLVKLLGESSDVIADKKNALVANSKLAQYEYDAGQFSNAAAHLEAIVAAFPSDRNYLRRAGLAWFKAGDHAKALPHWNTVVAGTESASDAWYEAKYYQLVCLAKTDPAAAGKAWRQFKLLHPEVKSAAWRDRFGELERTSFGKKN